MNDSVSEVSNNLTTLATPLIDRIFSNTSLGHRLLERLTLVNLRHTLYLITPYETAVPTLEQVPNYNVEVSAWWLTFVVIEFLILQISGHSDRFALNDSITSICAGMLSQCFKFGGRTVAIFLYVFIWNNFRLIELPWDSPWTWLLCLVFQDLMYYFGHRAVHAIFLHFEYDRLQLDYVDFTLKIAFFLVTMQTFSAFFDRRWYAPSLEISRCAGVVTFYGFLMTDRAGIAPHRIFMTTLHSVSALLWIGYCIQEPEKPVVKYNPPLKLWLKLYLLFHFTLLLAIFLHFEYDRLQLDYVDFTLKIAFFLVTMQTFSAFFDRRWYAPSLEISRCAGVVTFYGFLMTDRAGIAPHRIFMTTLHSVSALLWIGYCIQKRISASRRVHEKKSEKKKVAISIISKSESLKPTAPPLPAQSTAQAVINSAL
ncbi:hypothetical protein NECAME_15863 [Necator americanus]|uniref:Alkylglycerol monooxygenase C-terminal domain-containing protein n=1 Tax=Necator americanus TaxID=51031 RepID=W2SFJ7_NECAM|nr:hypothetical protein NECAME_15863 [Necator americanus]ETN68350.1 hypothetical protein NECAME_15863 [Necator americanus]